MIHVIPLDDMYEHVFNSQCPCGIRIENYNNQDVIIHSSFDGRELFEQADILTSTSWALFQLE